MLEKVKEYAAKWRMLEENDRVIVGVSGGADSVCLLFVLSEMKKQIPFEIIAVHVNHELRGEEAKRDEEYVKEICNQLGVICVTYSENVELIAKNRKQSTEEAGRFVRYEKFWLTMEAYNGTKIALAHHKNDNAETLLMNLARGTGLKGMGGIKPVSGKMIRPFLCLERKEIEEYLKKQHIGYCVDHTNEFDDYTRNRIRNHVIPYMEQYVNAATVRHMDDAMQQLREIQTYMQEQMLIAYGSCVEEKENSCIVKEEIFLKVPAVLQTMILKEALVRVAGSEKDLAMSHIHDLQALFQKQTGRKLDLPYCIEAKKCYEGVQIALKSNEQREFPFWEMKLQLGETKELHWEGKRILCKLMPNDGIKKTSLQKGGVQRFDYDIMARGVCIRTRQPGDYITIHPDGRTQKLKSFFINEKVPMEIRDEILLVTDGNHILWITGYRTNCMYQVSEHTKCVLEIQIDKGE